MKFMPTFVKRVGLRTLFGAFSRENFTFSANYINAHHQTAYGSIFRTLMMGLLCAGAQVNAISCPAYTNKAGFYEFRECKPSKIPIQDKSGVKPKTTEEKSARKAADYFIRLEMSNLMSEGGYESDVHFAPMVKKYMTITQEYWLTQKYTNLELLVCNKALLTEWKATGTKQYQFSYQMQSAVSLSKKLEDRSTTINATYQFSWIDGRWKVSQAKFDPHSQFTLLKDYMPMIKREADILPNSWQYDSESSKVAKKKYHLMLEANRKVCGQFEVM